MMEPCVFILSLKQEIESALFSSLLSVVRKEKAGRILAQQKKMHADTMLTGELLAMYAVRKVFGIPMPEQRIQDGRYGKPFLLQHDNIHFNISHCRNVVAVAVSDRSVGVDVQHIVPWREPLARRICTPDEWEELQNASDREAALTKLWTRKEAAVKMKGVGVAGIMDCPIENFYCQTCRREDYYLSVTCERTNDR